MIGYLLVILSIILDILILNIFGYQMNNITLFYPMFTIVTLSLVYRLFSEDKRYIKLVLVTAIIYGALILNNISLALILFSIVAYLTYISCQYKNESIIISVLKTILIVIIYDIVFYLILVFMRYISFDIYTLSYKLKYSIVLNTVYSIILYYVTLIVLKYRNP